MAVPKFQLNLDDEVNDDNSYSIVDASIAENVEDEKCVVAQYRTTKQQKQLFMQHIENCDRCEIPIEWVIDIADESNGWFYATAYHFDDINQTLHVMVPDKLNPTFDGQVQLDYRTIHLIECVDGKTDALFNKIVRDSVLKIKWDVDWFEEEEEESSQVKSKNQGDVAGKWVQSTARYYIRIANQLLVEDKELEEDSEYNHPTKGFVIITADLNVKLIHCHKNKGQEDFYRLIQEGIVQSCEESLADLEIFLQQSAADPSSKEVRSGNDNQIGDTYADEHRNDDKQHSGERAVDLGRLLDFSQNIRDSTHQLSFLQQEICKEEEDINAMWSGFVLDGDLDHGMQLMAHFSKIKDSSAIASRASEKLRNYYEDIDYQSGKLEKYVVKLRKMNNNYDLVSFDSQKQ